MFLISKLCIHAKLILFEIELIIYVKIDLAMNILQTVIRHKTQPTNFKCLCTCLTTSKMQRMMRLHFWRFGWV